MVAVGVLLLPVPAVGAHLLDAVLSHPAQLVLGLGGVCVALGDIAGAARVDDVGDLLAAGLGEGVDDIQHAVTLAGAQIDGLCAGVMTVPQLSATLAAAAIGKELGMLDNNFFNAIVVLSIVTTLPVPNIVRWLIEHYQLKFRAQPDDGVEESHSEIQDQLL